MYNTRNNLKQNLSESAGIMAAEVSRTESAALSRFCKETTSSTTV